MHILLQFLYMDECQPFQKFFLSSVCFAFLPETTSHSSTQTVKGQKAVTYIPFLWFPHRGSICMLLRRSIALCSHLFIRLQGQLNVALPLGLLLGINLRGTRVRGQHNGGEKGHPNYSEVEVASQIFWKYNHSVNYFNGRLINHSYVHAAQSSVTEWEALCGRQTHTRVSCRYPFTLNGCHSQCPSPLLQCQKDLSVNKTWCVPGLALRFPRWKQT